MAKPNRERERGRCKSGTYSISRRDWRQVEMFEREMWRLETGRYIKKREWRLEIGRNVQKRDVEIGDR
jgi:hypothetical protein